LIDGLIVFLVEKVRLHRFDNRQVIEIIDIAIVDDDPEVLMDLSRSVTAYMNRRSLPFSVRTFTSGMELLSHIQYFDVVFLDIQMDGISGMEAAKKLRMDERARCIVFITILREYVFDAFDVEAFDYLLKPIDGERFHRMMDRICRHFHERKESGLLISSRGNNFKSVSFSDIIYCEAMNHKVLIRTKGSRLECCLKINDLKIRLDNRFFQCHRSYFVNMGYVCGYEGGFALLKNGEEIPVSRLRAGDFSRKMLHYMRDVVS
jgi:DNA-binding LytR/AlgR family response regulator